MDDRRARLLRSTAHLGAPLAIVDEPALDANADDLVRRAAGLPVRIATKSVRVRSVIERTLRRPGFAGLMTYSLAESVWLADQGHDDVLLAYPSTDADAFAALVEKDHRREAITVMVDGLEQLDLVDAVLGPDHPTIRVCLDVDASLRFGPLHLGVRRSPVHSPRQAERVAAAVAERRGFELTAVMSYDAQIAGLPDSSAAVRLVKRRSDADLRRRRRRVVERVRRHADVTTVNAGGTGSLDVTGRDPVLTELTAGSGLFAPTLFDGYDDFTPTPAAYVALPVVRRPARDVVTLFGGGYIASGPTGDSRRPTPVWPPGLELLASEGAGEVQTPVRGRAARDLRVGDRVLFRHAKAGELFERFDHAALVRADGSARSVPTYRGEGRCFG